MSEQLDAVLGRLGYVRRDAITGREIAVGRDGPSELSQTRVDAPVYPQVVMVQGHSAGESWVRDHAGQLLVAAGVGVFGLVALTLVALVAVVVALAAFAVVVGMVSCTAALAIARAGVSGDGGGHRGR
jgi:hypothetical protein